MVYRVRILPGALQDARNYYEFIATYSPETAVTWFEGLFEVVDSLSTMPKRCPIAPETALIGLEIRCLGYQKFYRILYSIDEDIVRIHHIRHTSQEFMSSENFSV